MTKTSLFALIASGILLLAGCRTMPDDCCAPEAESSGHTATLGTNKIHYVVSGEGKHAVVMVHCWAGNLGFWEEQVPVLSDKAKVILLDLPGHGKSDKPQTAYTMDFFADAVLAVMKDAHISKATLVGHSMGVPVNCRVYQKAPGKVAALVAVEGALRRPPFPPEQAEGFTRPFHTPQYRAHTTNFISAMFPNPGTEALRDHVLAELLETPQYVMAGAMDGMFSARQPDWDLKKVTIPVLVINANNPMWNDDYKQYVRSLSPKTDYRAMDSVGHWLMLENPPRFNAILLEMLNEFDLIEK